MTVERLTKLVKIITSAATAFVFLLVAIIIAEYIKINSLNRKIDDVTQSIDNLSRTQSELETDMEYHSSSIYIEDMARRELKMLKDNEIYLEYK